MDNQFLTNLGYRTLALLNERNAIVSDEGKIFYVWEREDRAILVFDTDRINPSRINDDFIHVLSTRFSGRPIVKTNTRGLFLQIAYEIPPIVEFEKKPLDLSAQPSPYHLPIGSTPDGDIWLSLLEGDSFFVSGLRGMGKSAELHGFIQAMLHGGKTLVHAWDGKNNAEYLRYYGTKNFTLIPMDGLSAGLKTIQDEVDRRMIVLAKSGYPNIIAFNTAREKEGDFLPPIALVIDEVAEVDDQQALMQQVKVNRAAGIFPIFASNDTLKSAVIAKSNLATRISFYVVSASDSVTGFGRPGANKLPKVQGRGLIVYNARVTEFQSFTIPYNPPTQEGLQWLSSLAETQPTFIEPQIPEEQRLAETILPQWTPGMTKTKVASLLGFPQYGGSYKGRTDRVIEYLNSTTTTPKQAETPVLEAVAA